MKTRGGRQDVTEEEKISGTQLSLTCCIRFWCFGSIINHCRTLKTPWPLWLMWGPLQIRKHGNTKQLLFRAVMEPSSHNTCELTSWPCVLRNRRRWAEEIQKKYLYKEKHSLNATNVFPWGQETQLVLLIYWFVLFTAMHMCICHWYLAF